MSFFFMINDVFECKSTIKLKLKELKT